MLYQKMFLHAMRLVKKDLQIAANKILRIGLGLFRNLPLPRQIKTLIKNFLFTTFGHIFVNTNVYLVWKAHHHASTNFPPMPTLQETVYKDSLLCKTEPILRPADGVWEWSDYSEIESRIALVKHKQLAQVAPAPLAMIDIGKEAFEVAAKRIKLPSTVEDPDVSIIIPAFNNLKFTIECLLSISAHVEPEISFEVILADDASTDGTAEMLASVANLRIIRNKENLGFLRNSNNALKYAFGRYVVFLNNDVQVTKNWLSGLLSPFSSQAKVGAVGPKFVYPSGHLQEAGVALRHDATVDMVGLNDDAARPRYNYLRRVDYVSGACLLLPTDLARQMGGFSDDFLPCYCEDIDLCLRIQEAGYYIYYNPASTIIHHLSKTTIEFKQSIIKANLLKLQRKWLNYIDRVSSPKIIAFYLPQFHPFDENNRWWGEGFTEWTNVTKAKSNFVGHYQPRLPADLGFYDLRLLEVMQKQSELASRYGVNGFCYYYYWFGGKRLMERPIEQMLKSGSPNMPFCLCWANENWTRRWDGNDQEVLIAQSHSPEDDEAVIKDLIRYFRDSRYIRIDDRPLILIYRVTLFHDFKATAARWRQVCRQQGLGEIFITMVESKDLVHANRHPSEFGCDAAVEFPPLEMGEQKHFTEDVINPEFAGALADYRDIAVRFATRDFPDYLRFKGVMPGWDNTARQQNNSHCFKYPSPGAFQAWLEESLKQTRQQHYGDERIVFLNAWNEWAEGAYIEPDRRFGHTYLEAVKNAIDASRLLKKNKS